MDGLPVWLRSGRSARGTHRRRRPSVCEDLPGVFSQVVEGLDAILQMPYGCFEQTSSTTYPNILALNYMKTSGNVTPAVEMKALEYINLGYQRLLTFEIDGGGLSYSAILRQPAYFPLMD